MRKDRRCCRRFDALTSDHVYRPAFTDDQALAMMSAELQERSLIRRSSRRCSRSSTASGGGPPPRLRWTRVKPPPAVTAPPAAATKPPPAAIGPRRRPTSAPLAETRPALLARERPPSAIAPPRARWSEGEADEWSLRRDQAAAHRDRSAADRDHAASDRHQSQVEAEQRSWDRDEVAGDREQAAADRDQNTADRAVGARDRERTRVELRRAQIDQLTGALGRELGMVSLDHEINRARRGNGRLVLAYVDVDGLKEVNDRGGHAAGDELLRDVVGAIRAHLRDYDLIVRVGGDEFLCVLADSGSEDARPRFQGIAATIQQSPAGRVDQCRLRGAAPGGNSRAAHPAR